jgi:hypothetical protein
MAPDFDLEYVTSAVSLLKGDGIVIHVVNDSDDSHQTEAVIYQNTGAGAVIASDSGVIDLIPTWTWGLGFTISQSGEHWVRILASSDDLVPKVSFERLEGSVFTPVVNYKPGDFGQDD